MEISNFVAASDLKYETGMMFGILRKRPRGERRTLVESQFHRENFRSLLEEFEIEEFQSLFSVSTPWSLFFNYQQTSLSLFWRFSQ